MREPAKLTSQDKFGLYAPAGWVDQLLKITRARSAHGIQKKVAFVLRRAALKSIGDIADVEVEGLRLRLYPRQNLSDKRLLTIPAMLDGIERAYFAEHLKPRALVVDVGANMGGYSMLLKRQRPDLRLLAVEPDALLIERFQFNQAINRLLHDIQLEQSAISDRNGIVLFDTRGANRGENHICPEVGESSDGIDEVGALTLHALHKKHGLTRVDLVKLDIEGHEYPVMQKFFEESPQAQWPHFLQVEQYHRRDLNRTVSLCFSHGYELTLRSRMNVILKREIN